MSSNSRPLNILHGETSTGSKWTRRRDIPLAILAWIALVAVIIWAADHIIRSLVVLAIAALLAYALAPAVKLLQRVMPRFLAIIIVYLIVLTGLSWLCYLIVHTTIRQVIELKAYLALEGNSQLASLQATLRTYGIDISQDQINQARQQLVSHLQGIITGALPVLRRFFEDVLDIVVVAMLSIYLLLDGSRVKNWLRRNTPLFQREPVAFLLDTLERVVGGYIRGQLTLAILIGLLVGVGMGLLGVRSAVFLGALAFVFAFIPVLGTFISAVACILLALTSNPGWIQGWQLAIIVLVYFILVHVFEADIVGPRIVGHAIGLHPGVSIFALIVGTELFGIWGALFAAPLAGLVQAILVAIWREWRKTSPDQFPLEAPTDNVSSESEVKPEPHTRTEQIPTSSVSAEQPKP